MVSSYPVLLVPDHLVPTELPSRTHPNRYEPVPWTNDAAPGSSRTLHHFQPLREANPRPLDNKVSAYTNCATEPPDIAEGKTLLCWCSDRVTCPGLARGGTGVWTAFHLGAFTRALFPPPLFLPPPSPAPTVHPHSPSPPPLVRCFSGSCIGDDQARFVAGNFCYIHCSKHLRDQTFRAIYLEIYWGKSFQIVVLFSRIIVLDNPVVTEKKLAKCFFFFFT